MSTKYIWVTGGVCSSCGKGITACSIGLLLKLRGFNVQYIKFDPYHSLSPGSMSPIAHGEVWVTDDGVETDLDCGSAERFIGIKSTRKNIATSGLLYKQLLDEQENGKYLGECVQLTPHMTDIIQEKVLDLGKSSDIVIIEIGGTVGDAESYAFFEAARQFKQKYPNDVLITMVAPILWMEIVKEFKTKPLQNAVREIQRSGIQPDVLFCRVDREVPEKIIQKISNLTGIKRNCIFLGVDTQSVYQIPLKFYEQHVDDLFVDLFRLGRSACRIHKYREVVEKYINNELPPISIGLVGKYDSEEAYLSIKESIVHAAVNNDVRVNISWIKSEELEKYKDLRGLNKYFEKLDGVIIAPGFDSRGIEGKIRAIQYLRERKIPTLGICLGLQCMVIEFARNICHLESANSMEFDKNTNDPVIYFIPGQENIVKKHGNMRLGAYSCNLIKDTLAMEIYNAKTIDERHRHRYEVNPKYVELFNTKGLRVSGVNPDADLIEIMELDKTIHPFFIGSQFHPEFNSKLMAPAPLFKSFVSAALKYQKNQKASNDQ